MDATQTIVTMLPCCPPEAPSLLGPFPPSLPFFLSPPTLAVCYKAACWVAVALLSAALWHRSAEEGLQG